MSYFAPYQTSNTGTINMVLEPSKTCKCGRDGTIRWGDGLALAYGWTSWRCQRCVTREQLSHASRRTAALPKLLFRFISARVTWDTRKAA